MKTRVYLDNCCFGRVFDDQSDISIQQETEAIVLVLEQIRRSVIELAWSFILEYEIGENSDGKQKSIILPWRYFSVIDVAADEEIFRQGKILERHGFQSMDALHVACAIKAGCGCFLTTDKKILNKRVAGISLLNPMTYLRKAGDGA